MILLSMRTCVNLEFGLLLREIINDQSEKIASSVKSHKKQPSRVALVIPSTPSAAHVSIDWDVPGSIETMPPMDSKMSFGTLTMSSEQGNYSRGRYDTSARRPSAETLPRGSLMRQVGDQYDEKYPY
jgi:hypothetical protein